jgi:hypothetical protein
MVPDPIPCCPVKPLKYKDWHQTFCPLKEIHEDSGIIVKVLGECTPEEAFAKAVHLGSPELDAVQTNLQSQGFELSPDLTKIRDIMTGNERPAQEALTRLVYKEGRAGHLLECQTNPHGVLAIAGVERSCEGLLDEVINSLYQQGYSPSSQKGVYRRGTQTKWIEKTLAKAAQELDMKGPNLLKLYQSAVSKMKNRQENYSKLVAGYQEGLDLRKKEGSLNPLAPLVGCYITNVKGLTLCITQDPVEIALKSTGRPWQHNSCERITGVYPGGFIDDIGHNNAVAFAVDSDGKVLGRKMVRWGIPPRGAPLSRAESLKRLASVTPPSSEGNVPLCAGIEPVWYSTGMTAKIEQALDEKLIEVIQCNHLAAEECVTPYPYRGYSDAMGEGNVSAIRYAALGVEKRGEYLIGYLNTYYRQNVLFIFKANRLTYAQIQLLRQHDFEWASRDAAAEAFYDDAIYGELPFIAIQSLRDLENQLDCEDFEVGELTDEEKRLTGIFERFLHGPDVAIEKFIHDCLSDDTVEELLKTGDMTGRSLYLDKSEGNYHLFTENDGEYQGYMDDYLDNEQGQNWDFIEEHFQ